MPSTFRTSVCKIFKFEAAHHLPNYVGACKNLHGHSYKLEVEIGGVPASMGSCRGMIMDFSSLKKIVEKYVVSIMDHSDLNMQFLNPTAELMVEEIANRIYQELPEEIILERVRLWETDTSWAEWRRT